MNNFIIQDKTKYFINYEGKEDIYIIKKVDRFSYNEYYHSYLYNNYIYDDYMVFDTLEEALKSLVYTSKRIEIL